MESSWMTLQNHFTSDQRIYMKRQWVHTKQIHGTAVHKESKVGKAEERNTSCTSPGPGEAGPER